MGLFDRFKKQETLPAFSDEDIVSPVKGHRIPTAEIADSVFAEEMMGQTIGIVPADGVFACPVNGTVEVAFPTGHAYAVRAKNGVCYLVHIGIDTVSLDGKGFKSFLKQGQKVSAGQKAVEADLSLIKSAGYDTTTMLIVSEPEDHRVAYTEFTDVERAQKIN